MLCSNCRDLIKIKVGSMELAMCQNGHAFCENCDEINLTNCKCMIRGGDTFYKEIRKTMNCSATKSECSSVSEEHGFSCASSTFPRENKMLFSSDSSLKEERQEVILMIGEGNDQLLEHMKKKYSIFSLNQRLHQIMGTYLERSAIKTPSQAEDLEFCKLLRETFNNVATTELKAKIQTVNVYKDQSGISSKECDSQSEQANTLTSMSHARCAIYNQPNPDQTTPDAQFQPIAIYCFNAYRDQDADEPIDARDLDIPRNPGICPINTCQKPFSISDFAYHYYLDHNALPMERICAQECKSFFLDPKLLHSGINRCMAVLLVRDKMKNLGQGKFKNFIPILIMSMKVNLFQLCGSQAHLPEVLKSTQNFYLIWLTGLVPPKLPIFITTAVWTNSGRKPIAHIVKSGQVHSIRESQTPDALYKSGQAVVLSENQVNLLTNNGRNMIELQVSVH